MRFIQFINNRTEELMHEQDHLKSYSISREAESDALRSLMVFVRSVAKWFYFVKATAHYVAIQAGLVREPKAVIAEKKIEEQNAKLTKIGMRQLKRDKK